MSIIPVSINTMEQKECRAKWPCCFKDIFISLYIYIYIVLPLNNGPVTRCVKWQVARALRRVCRERFPQHQLRRKPLVSDPGMHHSMWVTHLPWCMSGSLTRGGGENVPGTAGACASLNFTYLAKGPCHGVPEPVWHCPGHGGAVATWFWHITACL